MSGTSCRRISPPPGSVVKPSLFEKNINRTREDVPLEVRLKLEDSGLSLNHNKTPDSVRLKLEGGVS